MVHCGKAKPNRGSNGNVVQADPSRRSNATAAPATVSGECSFKPLGQSSGKGTRITSTREPGDLPCKVKPAVGDDGEKDLKMNNTTQTKAIARADLSLLPIAFAVLGGLTLLFASGYAQASVLHDAAHDQRHAMAFPCH